MSMLNKALALCSGGPDCVVAAAMCKNDGLQISLLHFDYGQKAALAEFSASVLCAKALGMEMYASKTDVFRSLGMTASGLLVGDQRRKTELKGKDAWVPARNLILLSIAAGFAEVNGFSYLIIGNIADGVYPDNKPAFRAAFDEVLKHALSPDVVVRCLAPANTMTKAEVFKTGDKLCVPLGLTWSCYEGGERHCGLCGSCVKRRQAFMDAGVTDETLYEATRA